MGGWAIFTDAAGYIRPEWPFTLASLLCAAAPTALLLVIARFIRGLAAALLFPQVYAGIRLNFDETQARKAFGWLGMTLGLAAIAGQALGAGLLP